VLPTAYVDSKGINHFRFLPKVQTLDKYLPEASPEEAQRVTLQIFEDLYRAHTKGFVYGDRWSENMLVTPDHGLMHIDFDLEIYGNGARELEVGQSAFYAVCGGREKVLVFLGTLLGKTNGWFDIRRAEQFATRLAIQFENHPVYGSTVEDTAALFAIARSHQYAKKSSN
jgi:hypothetical protein